jgi:hypothetical protein
MKIEAMLGYSRSLRVTIPPTDANLVQLQGQISTLTEKIQLTQTRTTASLVYLDATQRDI